jgi:hypothetical protein
VDHQTVEEIERKNGQTVSDEKLTVSNDGNTVTDEFGNWKSTIARIVKAPPGSPTAYSHSNTSASPKGYDVTGLFQHPGFVDLPMTQP